MLQEFSEKLTAFFIQSNIIDESNRAWCQYIIEKKIMQAFFLIIASLIALLYNRIFEVLSFGLFFCSIRKRTGGWHAPYPWLCLMLSGLILLLVAKILIPITLCTSLFYTFLFNNILLCILLFIKPSYPWQLHFCKEEKEANLQKRNVLILLFLILNLIFLILRYRNVLSSMLWALIFSIGLLQVEVAINGKGGEQNEKKLNL
jgi:membrane protein